MSHSPQRVIRLFAVVALLAVNGGCNLTVPPATMVSPTASPRQVSGGTLRVVMPIGNPDYASGLFMQDPDPAVFDPHKDPSPTAVGALMRCCLARTLVSHNGRSTAEGGARLHPDLAAALPDVSADGLIWTFRLKEGIRYGPPLEDVEVTSGDFVRAFHRILDPGIASDAAFLYFDIEGAAEYSEGSAASISGLATPDDRTLVIRLTQPAGDFGARLALPVSSPLPPNPAAPGARFGVAEGFDQGYGRYFVSSGPYSLEGADRLDFRQAPGVQQPVSGLVPGESITLVRNPSWSSQSDQLRRAHADRIEISLGGSPDDALAGVAAGRADVAWSAVADLPVLPPEGVAAFGADRTHLSEYDSVRGITLNVAVPPLDDVAVRKAINLAVDKQRVVELAGGPVGAAVARHMAPDTVEDNLLRDYDPYATPGDRGDATAARAEMARSRRYDSDGDGRCDQEACRGLRAVTPEDDREVAETLRNNLLEVGIELDLQVMDRLDALDLASNPRNRVPLFIGLAWVKTQISAASFFRDQFYGPSAISEEFGNFTNVGATPEQLAAWGYEATEVPNIDARIDTCLPLTGFTQFECWAALDQHVMQDVVPWVPYQLDRFVAVTSTRVEEYAFDQLMSAPALDQIAVNE